MTSLISFAILWFAETYVYHHQLGGKRFHYLSYLNTAKSWCVQVDDMVFFVHIATTFCAFALTDGDSPIASPWSLTDAYRGYQVNPDTKYVINPGITSNYPYSEAIMKIFQIMGSLGVIQGVRKSIMPMIREHTVGAWQV